MDCKLRLSNLTATLTSHWCANFPAQPTTGEFHNSAAPSGTVNVLGDGNCLFRAVALLISGSEDAHGRLRQVVCDYISNFHTYFAVTANYVAESKMGEHGTWGTDMELAALSCILGCNIFVYTTVGRPHQPPRRIRYQPVVHSPSLLQSSNQHCLTSIFLCHVNGNHFEPVL
jgi:hypothetical protein